MSSLRSGSPALVSRRGAPRHRRRPAVRRLGPSRSGRPRWRRHGSQDLSGDRRPVLHSPPPRARLSSPARPFRCCLSRRPVSCTPSFVVTPFVNVGAGYSAAPAVRELPAVVWTACLDLTIVWRVGFRGWTAEAIDFYDGLEEDNSQTSWQPHTTT